MQNFTLDSSMTAAIGGAFYPTGHSFIMFPDAADARAVGQKLEENGVPTDAVYLLPPEIVLSQITPTTRMPITLCLPLAPRARWYGPIPSWRGKATQH